MKKFSGKNLTRRKFVGLAVAGGTAVALTACGDQNAVTSSAQSQAQPTNAALTNAPASTTASAPTSAATAKAATTNAATTQVSTATSKPASTTAVTTTTQAAATAGQVLAPTPTCSSKTNQTTLAETEGPYFKPSSPERTSLLETSISGTKLTVTGYVLTTDCQPVKGALLDFWQANASGQYDNSGFKLRGHQYTDANGIFKLETVVPGLYPGRTRHIHVKVQAPSQSILTTQLFFPNEPQNQRDSIFHQELLMQVQDLSGGSKQGNFNFVLKTA